ncbi:MAG: helix-turn-helix domain-containing protein [Hyphomicrobiaceae bacterium]
MDTIVQPLEKQSVRNEFARRLRELRVPRGYPTARSFARALDIDENRYTRYERAEVEPDLFMLRRICEVLDVTPTDLLSPAPEISHKMAARRNGHAHRPVNVEAGGNSAANGTSNHDFSIVTAAWDLAVSIVAARERTNSTASEADATDSTLADIGKTGEVYRQLVREPFETISVVLQEEEIRTADQQTAASLRARIDGLVKALRANPTA